MLSVSAAEAQDPARDRPDQASRERVEVSRVLLDVRVVDSSGKSIVRMTAGDFAVTIDGTPAPVDTVEWVSSDTRREGDALRGSPDYDGEQETDDGLCSSTRNIPTCRMSKV